MAAVVKFEESIDSFVGEEVGIPKSLILFILILTIGFPEIGEVKIEIGFPFGLVSFGHSPHPYFLIAS